METDQEVGPELESSLRRLPDTGAEHECLGLMQRVGAPSAKLQDTIVETLSEYCPTSEFRVRMAEELVRGCADGGLSRDSLRFLISTVYALSAEDASRASRLSQATLVAGRAVDTPRLHASASLQRAVLHSRSNHLPEADVLYREAIAADPDYSYAHSSYAVFAYERMRDVSRAEALFRTAIATGASAWTHWRFAWMLWEERREESETLKEFERAVDLDPRPEFRHDLALFLRHLKRFEAAEAMARELVASDISSRKNRLLLARVLFSAGQRDESLGWFERATDGGIEGDAHLMYADALWAAGRTHDARRQLELAMSRGLTNGERAFAERLLRKMER